LVVSLVLVACGEASSSDEERAAEVRSDPLLERAPLGATPVGELQATDPDEPDLTSVYAIRSWKVNRTITDVTRFYAEALVDGGWGHIYSSCVVSNRGDTVLVAITASRWDEGYEVSTIVEALADARSGEGLVDVKVSISAPVGDESGERPSDAEPNTNCLDGLSSPAV
jgi:hypothetical protein